MTHRLTIFPAFLRRLAAPLLSALVMASAISGSQAQLVNTGQANGTPASGSLTPPSSTVSIPIASAASAITVIKTVTANDENGDGHSQIGETLTYTFTVSNSGNVTLNNITLSDPTATVSGGPLAILAPGSTDSSTFSAAYTLSPADISAGSHSNQATGTATSAVPGSPLNGVTDLSDSVNPADGPGPNDPTVITFTDAPLMAVDDTGSANGLSGGIVPALNVLGNDTLNGVAVVPADVTITPVTTGPLTVNADGTVNVAPNTPAGPYTVSYTLCEVLNPANCDTADVVVTVYSPSVVANDDSATAINGLTGAPSALSAFANDTLNGVAVVAADITATIVTPSASPNVTMNLSTGVVSVAPDTAAGVYTITYRICENLNPANCDTATASLTVVAAALIAANDTGAANGLTGGVVPALNVRSNDTLNGVAVVPANVTVTPVTTGPLTVNADGSVNVAANTVAGPYTVTYTVCELLNPANCDTADVVITVAVPAIVAVDDTGATNDPISNTIPLLNVLANDTLNGVAAVPAEVTIIPVTTGPLTVNADGSVSIVPDTVAGVYTVTYTVCVIVNPANCDTADVTITVSPPTLVAADDTGSINGLTGGVLPGLNVLDDDTLNGIPGDTVTMAITYVTAGPLAVNSNGMVTVAPNTPAGTYTITYTVCEVLNPGNCDTADVVITVTAAPIVAADGSNPGFDGLNGSLNAVNVLANDSLNGITPTVGLSGNVTVSIVTPATSINSGPVPVLDPATGFVSVPAGTPSGTYTIVYQICERLNPANCDQASELLDVQMLLVEAVDDTPPPVVGASGNPSVINVFANDTINLSPLNSADIVATVTVSATNAGVALNTSTGIVSVAPGVPAGVYSITYRICAVLSPTCDTAIVTVTVTPAPIIAVDDNGTAEGLTGGVVPLLNVLGNDTLNGAAVIPADVTVTPVTTGPLTVNADGTVNVAPNTPSGPYTVTYTLCEVLNPANCDTADVVVTVVAPANRVSGVIYEDSNSNGVFDTGEMVEGGFTVQLVRNGVVIATTMSDPDGSYTFDDIAPGTGYSIAAIDPATGRVVSGRGTFDITSSSIIVDVNLPIDPSGVIYDSVTRLPIAGATVEMTDAFGALLPAACFVSPGQQPQTTSANGQYRFDVLPGINAACPVGQTEYRLRVSAPSGYVAAPSTTIVAQAAPLDATICPVDSTSGGSCAVQPQSSVPTGGASTIYFLSFLLQFGDPDVVHNHIPLDPIIVVPGDVSVTKAARSQIGLRGGVMTYTITATNNGSAVTSDLNLVDQMPAGFTLVDNSATLEGVPVTAVVSGRTVRLPSVTIPASGRVVVVLQLRIPVTAAPGDYVNNAFAVDASTGDRVGTGGSATIRLRAEAVFDCGDVIGKVFDDRNANGYQDQGELGIAGVRLATVKGELITTDKNGQYHVPCAMLPDQRIGSNFILKLDTRTLPTGYRVTTENPRVIRLTAGKIAKLNFGATIGRVVRLDLRGDAFVSAATSLKPEWEAGLDGLVATLAEKNSILRLTYFEGDDSRALSRQRAAAVKKLIEAKWKRDGADYRLLIEVDFVKRQ